MADHDDSHSRPQQQAIPRMLLFLGTIVVIAVALVLWFSLGNH